MKLINTYIITLFILLCSCIKEADEVAIPRNLEKQIIVKCFISPQDTVLKVSLRQSIPFFNKDDYHLNEQYIKDAKVIISDGIKAVQLTYGEIKDGITNPEFGAYTCPSSLLPIRTGNEYYLFVDAPDGRHVDAKTKIPEIIPSFSIVRRDSVYNYYTGWIYTYNFESSARDQYSCIYTVNYNKLEYVWFDYDSDSIVYSKSTPMTSSTSTFNGTGYWKEYYNEYRNYVEKFSSAKIFYYNKGLSNYFPNNMKDPLDAIDSTFDATQEPLYMEPYYFNSKINGGLGFFEGYQQITQTYNNQ